MFSFSLSCRDSENSSCLFPQFFLASLRSSRPRHRGSSSARTFYVVTETGSWPRCSSSAGPQPPPQHWFSLLPRTGFKVHHHQGFSIPMAPDIAFFLFHLQFMAMTSQDLIMQQVHWWTSPGLIYPKSKSVVHGLYPSPNRVPLQWRGPPYLDI